MDSIGRTQPGMMQSYTDGQHPVATVPGNDSGIPPMFRLGDVSVGPCTNEETPLQPFV